jgi:FixJ family two-component response regulator
VVLCDLFMPDMDGLEVIGQLRRAQARVVAMSGGFGDMDLLGTAKLLGAVQALQKPFTQQEIIETIERAAKTPPA